MCQIAWKYGKTPRDWQTGVMIPILKKGDCKQCKNYRGISLLSFPRKLYAKCLERKYRKIVESKQENGQCGFCSGRSTTYQIFILKQIFEKCLEEWQRSLRALSMLKKHKDKVWKVSREYGADGQLLRAIESFYSRPEVCVRVNGKQSKPFHKGVGLRQGSVLSPLLFIVNMNWIDKCSQANECATIGNYKISRLLFADDLVLLSSSESGLQRILNSFEEACDTAK